MERIGRALRREHLVLAATLLVLHGMIWSPLGTPLALSLMLAHLGLFLLWQPIWSREQRLSPPELLAFGGLTLAALAWQSWWLVCLWLVLLIGIVAGRSPASRRARYAYLLALVFLVGELLVRGVPSLFHIVALPGQGTQVFQGLLTVVPIAIALTPFTAERGGVDMFRGIAVALLVAILATGGLIGTYQRAVPYPQALAQALLVIAGFLLVLSWLLSPSRGLSGFAQLWERALLNIGTPFEAWLGDLADLANREATPGRFLEQAMTALVRLPWISGVAWESTDGSGTLGTLTPHAAVVEGPELCARICTRRPPGPMLYLHAKLLLQVLGHFHLAKVRERALAQQAHLQAIYETGARVTHDIKNLLQSLHTIAGTLDRERAAVPEHGERRRGGQKAQRLFERQLPHLLLRLQLALDKLQAPARGVGDLLPARAWWRTLCERVDAGRIDLEEHLAVDPPVPVELFDSVVDNLLENATAKQVLDPSIRVTVRLAADEHGISLEVADTGEPLPQERAARIGREPLNSDNGLGIGLYQAARQAELAGFRLALARNEPGDVVFELARRPGGDTRQFPLFSGGAGVAQD